MADQWNDQGIRDSESEEVRGRAEMEDEFEDVTEDQDEEDLDDEDATF